MRISDWSSDVALPIYDAAEVVQWFERFPAVFEDRMAAEDGVAEALGPVGRVDRCAHVFVAQFLGHRPRLVGHPFVPAHSLQPVPVRAPFSMGSSELATVTWTPALDCHETQGATVVLGRAIEG